MRIVTKAVAIQFIDGKCHIKKWKSGKIVLSDYYACVSRDLLLVSSGVDTHTNVCGRSEFKKPGLHTPGLTICMRCYAFLSDETLFT